MSDRDAPDTSIIFLKRALGELDHFLALKPEEKMPQLVLERVLVEARQYPPLRPYFDLHHQQLARGRATNEQDFASALRGVLAEAQGFLLRAPQFQNAPPETPLSAAQRAMLVSQRAKNLQDSQKTIEGVYGRRRAEQREKAHLFAKDLVAKWVPQLERQAELQREVVTQSAALRATIEDRAASLGAKGNPVQTQAYLEKEISGLVAESGLTDPRYRETLRTALAEAGSREIATAAWKSWQDRVAAEEVVLENLDRVHNPGLVAQLFLEQIEDPRTDPVAARASAVRETQMAEFFAMADPTDDWSGTGHAWRSLANLSGSPLQKALAPLADTIFLKAFSEAERKAILEKTVAGIWDANAQAYGAGLAADPAYASVSSALAGTKLALGSAAAGRALSPSGLLFYHTFGGAFRTRWSRQYFYEINYAAYRAGTRPSALQITGAGTYAGFSALFRTGVSSAGSLFLGLLKKEGGAAVAGVAAKAGLGKVVGSLIGGVLGGPAGLAIGLLAPKLLAGLKGFFSGSWLLPSGAERKWLNDPSILIALVPILFLAIFFILPTPLNLPLMHDLVRTSALIVPQAGGEEAGLETGSPYISATKTPASETLPNGSATLEYTIKLGAVDKPLSSLQLVDATTIYSKSGATTLPERIFTAKDLASGASTTLNYKLAIDDYRDATIINTVTITADTPDESGETKTISSVVTVGKPPAACFVPANSGPPDGCGSKGSPSSWSNDWNMVVAAAAVLSKSQQYLDTLCGADLQNTITVYRVRKDFGGGCFSGGAIYLYNDGVSSFGSAVYTLAHETGHVVDDHTDLFDVFHAEAISQREKYLPTYPNAQSEGEDFAETLGLYMGHAYYYPNKWSRYPKYPENYPLHYNFAKKVFGGIEF